MNMNEPKLRFKADDGSEFPDWEEKKVANLFSKIKEKNKDGKIQNVITNSAEFGLINQRDFFDKDIAIDGKTENYTTIKTGDFVYNPRKSKQAPYGPFNCYQLKEEGIVSPLYTCLRPKGIANAEYLLWYFQSGAWYRFIYENGAQNGARHDRVGMTDSLMQDIPVYVPRLLEEQQKIADFLSTIDTVIEKQKATIGAWEERKKGVMQKLFSQEVRFKADDGSEFPEWENVTVLDLLVQPITDGPHETPVLEENGVSFVSVEAIDNGRVNLTKRRGFISKEYDNVCAKKYKPRLYDVYMVKSGATTGKVAIVTITDDFNIWSPLAAMRTSSKTEAFFLYYQLQSDMIQNQVWTKLSLGNQPNLGMRALELFSAVRPCLAEQQKIVDCLSSLDEVIEKQKATLAAWEELKKGLLQQMFV